jgi:hypothetical protein
LYVQRNVRQLVVAGCVPAARRALLALFAGAALAAGMPVFAECRAEGENEVAAAESCAIPGADYPLVRVRATLSGSAAGVAAILQDPDTCPLWLSECVGEREHPARNANRTLIHRVTGSGLSRRVTVATTEWRRLPGGGAVLDLVGADDEETPYGGTRVLCTRERVTVKPAAGGRVDIIHEGVRDPQPPFGLGSAVVTPATVEIMLDTMTNLAKLLRQPEYRNPPPLDDLPELAGTLPDLGASFARCQAARR